MPREDLKNFTRSSSVNRERVAAGNLAEADFYRISLQKLQFEQDVSAAELALVQAQAALRQNVGFDVVPEDFDVDGDLAFTKYTVTLDELKRDALAARPDLLAAQSGMKLAADTQALDSATGARDVTGEVEYDRAGSLQRDRLRDLVRAAVPRPQPGEHRAERRSPCRQAPSREARPGRRS